MWPLKLFNRILFILLFFVFVGCSVLGVVPKTNAEKLLQIKLTYSEVLDTALKYQKAKLLSEYQEAKLSKAFKDFHEAEKLADMAINIKNTLAFNNQMETMRSIITILDVIIKKPESLNKGDENVYSNRTISKRFIIGLYKYCGKVSRRSGKSGRGWEGSGCGRINSYNSFQRKQTVAIRV